MCLCAYGHIFFCFICGKLIEFKARWRKFNWKINQKSHRQERDLKVKRTNERIHTIAHTHDFCSLPKLSDEFFSLLMAASDMSFWVHVQQTNLYTRMHGTCTRFDVLFIRTPKEWENALISRTTIWVYVMYVICIFDLPLSLSLLFWQNGKRAKWKWVGIICWCLMLLGKMDK